MIAAGGGMIKSIDFTNDDAVNFQVNNFKITVFVRIFLILKLDIFVVGPMPFGGSIYGYSFISSSRISYFN